jgi:uncharacterized protein YecE (DUF72 family)
MRILAGTSGWQYKEWKGSFYPEDLSTGDMLSYYAQRFPTVEVNNTFYRMPKPAVLADWASQVPDGFQFVLKASRRITHFGRLKEGAQEPLQFLLESAATLGDRLGPILFQTPPNLKKDLPRLKAFLGYIPRGVRGAFEFRHESWPDQETADVLREHDMALCIANTEDEEPPWFATASYGYLRLRKVRYEEGELEGWAERIRSAGWKEAFVFFKHEDEGTGPRLAKSFTELFD